ncbi:hypothetical protein ACN38_g10705 [Penicillium nordicum]|uniref:Uncharacterized protein n=1 Tax=Penicillium nordicum TaxID=229535 RepID=A0A0M9WBD6_9EURO|nr:hypothetical protein ACN38_g10705 [Penicillium nordicum]
MLRRQGPRDNGYTLEIQGSSPTLQFRMTPLTLMRNLRLNGWDCCGPWSQCQEQLHLNGEIRRLLLHVPL